MKTSHLTLLKHAALLVLLSTLNPKLSTALAQGTTFTYQGRLTDNGGPANGSYDFRFRLASDALGNNLVAGPLLTNGVTVASGLFTVTLNFGAGIFTGSNYWLQVEVKTNAAVSYTTLTPLQALMPTPYAIYAGKAMMLDGALPGSQLSGTYTGAVTFNNGANSFTGNGGGLTNLNAVALGGLNASNFWQLGGNANANPTNNNFLGTTDNLPLELRVNGTRALRLEPTITNGAVNVVGGSPFNTVGLGVVGATIGGGGAFQYLGHDFDNRVTGDYGTVSGGGRNTSSGLGATVSGGGNNSSSGEGATVGGGSTNYSGGAYSTIGGGGPNGIDNSADYSTIGGGEANLINNFSDHSTIGGGIFNIIGLNASYSTISGGADNTIEDFAELSSIGGGLFNTNLGPYAVVPGGDLNVAGDNSFAAGHRAKATHKGSFVWADSTDTDFATTTNNQFLIRASGFVGINKTNPATALDVNGTVKATLFQGNGASLTSLSASNIAGGTVTSALTFSNAANQFIGIHTGNGSGLTNLNASQLASGTVADARLSTNVALLNTAQIFSNDKTFGSGAQLFLDSGSAAAPGLSFNGDTNNGILSPAADTIALSTAGAERLRVTSSGNVGIGTTNPTNKLHVAGGVSATAFVTTSDRNAKENFTVVDAREVLAKVAALPITIWTFKELHDGPHMGPMAQDFYAAFHLGGSDTTITTIDPDGVALAAIQGLNQKVEVRSLNSEGRIQKLEAENAELKQRLEKLERLMNEKKGGAR